MDGLNFLHQPHLTIGEEVYLPYASLFDAVDRCVHLAVAQNRYLKAFLPSLIDVDIFAKLNGNRFALFVSTERQAHLPSRGIEHTKPSSNMPFGLSLLPGRNDCVEVTDTAEARSLFDDLDYKRGFAAIGTFPLDAYDDAAKAAQRLAAMEIANLMLDWAQRRYNDMEASRIFLSHRGVNKPLIGKVDHALRTLNLKTWFDRDDLSAGDPLLRGVDNAFAGCSAAVFFVSSDFVDDGVIAKEIDRALHEAALRPNGFRLIPLVLAQHGGRDEVIPSPLRPLVWKTVDDIEILPTILRSLPTALQQRIEYVPPK